MKNVVITCSTVGTYARGGSVVNKLPVHVRGLLCAATLALVCSETSAQVFTNGNDTVFACSGSISHSYPPDYDQHGQLTICPETAGSVTQLDFQSFNLQSPAQADVLTIYNGPSAAFPVLDSYISTSLQGQSVTASPTNISGCLTLQMNGSEGGSFSFLMSCVQPCAPPIASFQSTGPTPVLLCGGDSLHFDASGSTTAPERSIAEYKWFIGNSFTLSTTEPTIELLITEAGPYTVRLIVTDDLGCQSALSPGFPVLIASTPLFNGTEAPLATCIPEEIQLTGSAATHPWVETQPTSFEFPTVADGAFLADQLGPVLTSSILVSTAPDGAVINDPSELGNISLDIEHSFMADLVIQLVCPNGQSALLHQQGGGSTFLGAANDNDPAGQPVPGDCWNYRFNSIPEHGTLDQSAWLGLTTPVGAGYALNSGSYTSVQPLTNLVGCPLNGAWTLRILDLWLADNGFLCGWSIGLDVGPDSTFFGSSPTIALDDPNATFWSGNMVVNTPSNANATSFANTIGQDPFIFTVTDSYGCEHDTAVVVLRTEPPPIVLDDHLWFCGDSIQLNAALEARPDVDCSYTLRLRDSQSNGWAFAVLEAVIDGISTTYEMPPGELFMDVELPVVDGGSIDLIYTAGSQSNSQNSFQLINSFGELLYSSPNGPQTGLAFSATTTCAGHTVFLWSPFDGVAQVGSQYTTALPSSTTMYTVTATRTILPTCSAMDSVLIDFSPMPIAVVWNEDSGQLCAETDMLTSYEWYLNGLPYEITTVPCLVGPPAGSWQVSGVSMDGCPAQGEVQIVINQVPVPNDPLLIHTVTPNPNYGIFTVRIKNIDAANATLNVLEMTGRVVHTKWLGNLRGEVNIPVSMDAAPGVYLVELTGGGQKLVQRIIVR